MASRGDTETAFSFIPKGFLGIYLFYFIYSWVFIFYFLFFLCVCVLHVCASVWVKVEGGSENVLIVCNSLSFVIFVCVLNVCLSGWGRGLLKVSFLSVFFVCVLYVCLFGCLSGYRFCSYLFLFPSFFYFCLSIYLSPLDKQCA